jgi:molecular chaperone DnaK
VPQIEVSFEIDVNGILKVGAQDLATHRQQSITISNTGGLSPNEVERMRQEAEDYAELDRRRIKLVEFINQADNLFYNYESTIKDNPNLIREELRTRIKQQKNYIELILEKAGIDSSISLEEIKQTLENFQQILFEVGAEVYNQSQGNRSEEIAYFENHNGQAKQNNIPSSRDLVVVEQNLDLTLEDDESTNIIDYEPMD